MKKPPLLSKDVKFALLCLEINSGKKIDVLEILGMGVALNEDLVKMYCRKDKKSPYRKYLFYEHLIVAVDRKNGQFVKIWHLQPIEANHLKCLIH